MVSSILRQHPLRWLSLGLAAILFIIPPTGRIIRQDLTALVTFPPGITRGIGRLVTPTSDQHSPVGNSVLLKEAARHPGDCDLQVAAALSQASDSPDRVRRLEALSSQFPDQPAIYAHILRYLCSDQVQWRRPEEWLLTSETFPSNPGLCQRRWTYPRLLAAVDVQPGCALYPPCQQPLPSRYGADGAARGTVLRSRIRQDLAGTNSII